MSQEHNRMEWLDFPKHIIYQFDPIIITYKKDIWNRNEVDSCIRIWKPYWMTSSILLQINFWLSDRYHVKLQIPMENYSKEENWVSKTFGQIIFMTSKSHNDAMFCSVAAWKTSHRVHEHTVNSVVNWQAFILGI